MADRPFLESRRWQEQQWRAVRHPERRPDGLYGAHPDLLEFERVFIRRMTNLGVPMFASEIWRSKERQDDLFALGNSKAKAGQSPHQYGVAVDLVHSVKGWALAEKQWDLVGHVGKEVSKAIGVPMTWGGDWKFYDPAHWELDDWKTIKEDYPWPKKK